MINRARKNGLSFKDKSWLRKSVETKLQLETLENRELLAADMLAGLADLAEGEVGDKVQMRLVATDNSGNPITKINLNDTFQLRALTTDLRTDGDGVFATFLDIEYPSQFASVIGAATYTSPYTNFKSGTTTTAGLMDEIGSMAGLSTLGTSEYPVFSVPMKATGEGTILFTSNPADVIPAHDVLVYGENDAVSSDIITYGSYSLEVTAQGTLPFEEDFNDGIADDFSVTSGVFEVINNGYDATPDSTGSNAFSLVDLTVTLPNKVRMETTVNMKNISGYLRTGVIVFDYVDANNYKYVGANASRGKWFMNEVKNGSLRGLETNSASIQADTDYDFEMRMEGNVVTFYVNEQLKMTHDFGTENLRDGKLGVGTLRAITSFDNVRIAEILPSPEATDDAAATLVNTPITIAVLANDTHENAGTAIEIESATDGTHGTIELIDSNQDGKKDSITYTPGTDFRGVDSFEYIVTDAADQTDRGSVAVVTAGPLPIVDDFSDNLAQDLLYDPTQWQVSGQRFTAVARAGNFAGVLIGEPLPAGIEFNVTMNIQSIGGFNRNGYFVFDYKDESNYKYIGANENGRRWEVVEVSSGTTFVTKTLRDTIRTGQDYQMQLIIEGSTVTLNVDGTEKLKYQFDENLNLGGLALYTNMSKTQFDNVEVKEYVVLPVAHDDRTSTKIDTEVTIGILANDEAPNGILEITGFTTPANATVSAVDTDQDSQNDSILFTPTAGFEGVTTFTYDIRDPEGFTDTATVTVSVADSLSYAEDFNDGVADGFAAVKGSWEVVNSQYSLNAQGTDGISVLTLAETVPEDFEIGVTMNVAGISGFAQNAFIVFDYISTNDFKFAGALVGGKRWTIGEYSNGSRRFLSRTSGQMAADTDLAISLLYQGQKATLKSDGESVLEWQFSDAGNDGQFGLFAINAQVEFDDFYAKAVDAAMGE
jgi:hypothetical protein